jgi:hypothetical protein
VPAGIRATEAVSMGRGGGLGELVDLLEAYVEARIEGCASREYTIVYGDGVCIVVLLTRLKPADDDFFIITPLTLIVGLDRSSKLALAGVVPDVQAIAVRKGSSMHAELADLLARTYHEGLREADVLVVERREEECYVAVAGVKREDFNAEEAARAISKAVVKSLVKASEWAAEAKLCSGKGECLKLLLEQVKALTGCD